MEFPWTSYLGHHEGKEATGLRLELLVFHACNGETLRWLGLGTVFGGWSGVGSAGGGWVEGSSFWGLVGALGKRLKGCFKEVGARRAGEFREA